MKPALFVVATPIGNLGDLSPRAAEVLKAASLVLCEDTRHSKPLLDRIGAHARLVSCHAHNERERLVDVMAAIQRGESVALISDAGAPAVSDPGGKIVEEAVAAGIEVEVVPGASALVAALMGAGIDASRFCFLGFLPRSGKARSDLVDAAVKTGFAVVLYEAPQRVEETLVDLARAVEASGGRKRRVVVARELTKLHETFHRGVLGEPLAPAFVEKGEAVIVVEAGHEGPRDDAGRAVDVNALAADTSLPPKERAKRIAAALGIPVKDAYARVQKATMQSEDRLTRARALLAEAAHALADADLAARRERGGPPSPSSSSSSSSSSSPSPPVESDIPGADAIFEMLGRGPSLRAPVESVDAAKAVLAALAALDALDEALAMEAESHVDER